MEQHIIQIISQIKDDEQLVKDLNEHSNIMEDGGLDSLQMINFILKVEEQFGIEIDLKNLSFPIWNQRILLLPIHLNPRKKQMRSCDEREQIKHLLKKA